LCDTVQTIESAEMAQTSTILCKTRFS